MRLNDTLTVPLTQGKFAIISTEDSDRVLDHKWHARTTGGIWYAVNKNKGLLHRFILDYPEGPVDHINGDGLDCQRSNMRLVSYSQNRMNSRLNSRNKSGFRGVSWNKNESKWQASICLNGKATWLGYYEDINDAASAYAAAAEELFGEYRRT